MYKCKYEFEQEMAGNIKNIISEYKDMKELDMVDKNAAFKMVEAKYILDEIRRQEGEE